ncbi:CLUMA_CG006439, isoform A [Clunio marinus]|uniref:CLUMA_CG006439, isoform A n=1 Tax=Clunio marinus TaxID=568069 RepID=A0A1J1I313_9DIPT|nr:CLUMA_CG006439, isoform A [Clunio marinus]
MPAHQKVSGIEENLVPGSSFSAKYAKDEKISTPMAEGSIIKCMDKSKMRNVKSGLKLIEKESNSNSPEVYLKSK